MGKLEELKGMEKHQYMLSSYVPELSPQVFTTETEQQQKDWMNEDRGYSSEETLPVESL